MTHLLAILALMCAWINKITPESFIVHYHSFSTHVSLLRIPNSLPLPLTTTRLLWRLLADMIQINAWKGSYAYDIALSTANLAAASEYNRISWKFMCPSGRYTTYGDSYFSSLDNKLQYEPLQLSRYSQGTNQTEWVLQIFNAAPISMLCGHRKCLNFHA